MSSVANPGSPCRTSLNDLFLAGVCEKNSILFSLNLEFSVVKSSTFSVNILVPMLVTLSVNGIFKTFSISAGLVPSVIVTGAGSGGFFADVVAASL